MAGWTKKIAALLGKRSNAQLENLSDQPKAAMVVEPHEFDALQTDYYQNETNGFAEAFVAEKDGSDWVVYLQGLRQKPDSKTYTSKRGQEHRFPSFQAALTELRNQEKMLKRFSKLEETPLFQNFVSAQHVDYVLERENIVEAAEGHLAYVTGPARTDRPGTYELTETQIKGGYIAEISADPLSTNNQQLTIAYDVEAEQLLADVRAELIPYAEERTQISIQRQLLDQNISLLNAAFETGAIHPYGTLSDSVEKISRNALKAPSENANLLRLWAGNTNVHNGHENHETHKAGLSCNLRSMLTANNAQLDALHQEIIQQSQSQSAWRFSLALLTPSFNNQMPQQQRDRFIGFYTDHIAPALDKHPLAEQLLTFYEQRGFDIAKAFTEEPTKLFLLPPKTARLMVQRLADKGQLSEVTRKLSSQLVHGYHKSDRRTIQLQSPLTARVIYSGLLQHYLDTESSSDSLFEIFEKEPLGGLFPSDVIKLSKAKALHPQSDKLAVISPMIDLKDWPKVSTQASLTLDADQTLTLLASAPHEALTQLITDFVPPFNDPAQIADYTGLISQQQLSSQQWCTYLQQAKGYDINLTDLAKQAHQQGNAPLLRAFALEAEKLNHKADIQAALQADLSGDSTAALLNSYTDWHAMFQQLPKEQLFNALNSYCADNETDVLRLGLAPQSADLLEALEEAGYDFTQLDHSTNPLTDSLDSIEDMTASHLQAILPALQKAAPEAITLPIKNMAVSEWFANLEQPALSASFKQLEYRQRPANKPIKIQIHMPD